MRHRKHRRTKRSRAKNPRGKFTKCLEYAKDFAFNSKNTGIEPFDLAELIQNAIDGAKVEENISNYGSTSRRTKAAERHQKKVESIAKKYGYGAEWNGLYPTLKKSGRTEFLVYP